MADVESAFNLPLTMIPTRNLAWSGWSMDYLLAWLPTGLAANILPFVASLLAFGILRQRNSTELITGGRIGTGKLAGAIVLFCVAMYSTMITTSTVFLYFNF